MIQTQPYPIESFNGGITDNYLDGDAHRFRYGTNFIITNNQKLYTRPGSEHYDTNNYLIPAGNQRIGSLMNLNNELFVQSAQKFYYYDTTYQTLQGPTGNDVFSLGGIGSYVSWTTWNNHLLVNNDDYAAPMKIFRDNANNLQVRNCGLPALSSSPVVTPAAGANNYLYAFTYFNEYTVGDRTFQDFGPTTLVEVTNADAPDSSSVTISSIPSITNGLTDNYDTSNIKVKIYRTTNGGTDFYLVGQVNNGVSGFIDNVADTTLISNETLYTNDGTLNQEPAPTCKYLHVTNNFGWYAHIKEGSEVYENRIIQSFTYNPDSVNSTFFVDVDDVITGLSSYNFTPIVGCKGSMYRLDGFFTDSGGGAIIAQKISDVVGCVSNRSFVRTKKGTFFAGNDGFYWTDAFQVIKISDEFNDRYKTFVQNEPEKIYGTYDEENDRVLWAVQSDSSNFENDTIYCFDLKYGVKEDGAFTVWENDTSFRPSAVLYHNKSILRADSRGYIFRHDVNVYVDPRVDTTVSAANWVDKEIIYNYESSS